MVLSLGIPGGTATYPCLTSCIIYDTILTNTQLVEEVIGTYTYQNGFTRPSVCIDKRPDTVNVVGLEVVVASVPDGDIKRMPRALWTKTTHTLFVTDHTNTFKNMEELLIALSLIFSGFDAQYFYTADGRRNLEVPQAVVQFCSHQILRVKRQYPTSPNGSLDTNIPTVGGLNFLD